MAPTGNLESKPVNADRSRKRVEAETSSVKRAKSNCGEWCNKSDTVALISTDDCGLESKIKTDERKESLEVKKSKKERNPRKKPLTPFFLFLEDFRESFNKANPDNKKVSVVGREAGEKWRAMSEEEKKPYNELAAKQQEAHDEYWSMPIAIRKMKEEEEAEAEMELMLDEEWFFFNYKRKW